MANNSKKIRAFISKHWIILWIVSVSVILVSVIGVWAAYTDANQKIKRVIAPAAAAGSLFTSNYLKSDVGSLQYVYFNQGDTISYNVIVRNYNPADPDTIFDGNIKYKMYATLVHRSGTEYTAAETSAMSDESIVISLGEDVITLDKNNLTKSGTPHTLTSTNKDDTWSVTYNNIETGSDFCIKLEARPDEVNLDSLSATILVVPYPQVHPEGWTCAIAEPVNQTENSAVNDYDAFNYVISGTGKRTLEFIYNAEKLIVNPASYQFYNEIAAPVDIAGRQGWKKIVINADPETTKNNRYDFQVYKIGGWIPNSFQLLPDKENSYIEFTQAVVTP